MSKIITRPKYVIIAAIFLAAGCVMRTTIPATHFNVHSLKKESTSQYVGELAFNKLTEEKYITGSVGPNKTVTIQDSYNVRGGYSSAAKNVYWPYRYDLRFDIKEGSPVKLIYAVFHDTQSSLKGNFPDWSYQREMKDACNADGGKIDISPYVGFIGNSMKCIRESKNIWQYVESFGDSCITGGPICNTFFFRAFAWSKD